MKVCTNFTHILQVGWSYPVDVWGAGCILAEIATGKKPFGEQLLDNTHLLLMERYLEREFSQQVLSKAWAKGQAKKSRLLVQKEGAAQNVLINPKLGDILQERKLREARVLQKEITDPKLVDLLHKLLVFEPTNRSTAGALRTHVFFAQARFDKRYPTRIWVQLWGATRSPVLVCVYCLLLHVI